MKIQFQDKEAIDLEPGVPRKNKVTDADMNEIKTVVNTNADTLDSTVETVENFVDDVDDRMGDVEGATANLTDRMNTAEGSITNLQTEVGTIENTTYTKTETDNLLDGLNTTLGGRITDEATARENADNGLQRQIDSIVASSDVVDIVGTYQDLQNYDTSKLGDNDIIKVLDDSTHNNATSYFRWKKSQATWQYIGSEGPYYTKAQADVLLNNKVDKVTGKGLSTNDFTTALLNKLNGIEEGAQVNKIETIKVNNVTQTITSKSVNITVPTKTSDINNDSGFITKDVNNLTNYTNNTNLANTYQTKSNLVTSISSSSTDTQYPSAKCVYDLVGDINSLLDEINGEVI